jgi:hypothetical protein
MMPALGRWVWEIATCPFGREDREVRSQPTIADAMIEGFILTPLDPKNEQLKDHFPTVRYTHSRI